MGRPYVTELSELDATYEWCMQAPVEDLARSIGKTANNGLIAVGSGGSLTSAHFASFLHTFFTGQVSQVFTPYELVASSQSLGPFAVLVCSAGGSNPDILLVTEFALKRAPRTLFGITTQIRSPLQEILHSAGWAPCHSFRTPTKKDGFLATNSLLAMILLLIRAYELVFGTDPCLPPTFAAMLHPDITRDKFKEAYGRQACPVLERATLVVLHGLPTKPAAMDIESRMTESALTHVQPADFRNFAHGRHHWLSRHAASSGVLAFTERGDAISKGTLKLIPASIPRVEILVEPGIRGALAAVCHSLFLPEIAATPGYDPGRPRVASFGRKLYHLRALSKLVTQSCASLERLNLAVERKTGLPLSALSLRGELKLWHKHYFDFVQRLARAKIQAVVLDYDGTLCAPPRRFSGLTPDIANRLNQLLDAGLTIAVATGRGKSVREALRRVITVPQHRDRVIVGYHNGAEIATLSDLRCPTANQQLASELNSIAKALEDNTAIKKSAVVNAKGRQITLEPLPLANNEVIFKEVTGIIRQDGNRDVSIVTSGHSMDILGSGVSKTNVVKEVVRRLNLPKNGATSILCIGDRGCAPGNDWDLLRHPLSLSVDEVSADSSTCWNIAKPGLRFQSACFEYLERLKTGRKGMRFDVNGFKP